MENITGGFAEKPLSILENQGISLIRPDRMYESLRVAEYDISSGLGELVDNPIDAGAQNIWIITKTESQSYGSKAVEVLSEIAVVDDGHGMDADILNRSLVLGDGRRSKRGSTGIGKFGVGLTLGGISLARRLEVYSRDDKRKIFLYTYLDLDLVKHGVQKGIPVPIAKDPPSDYMEKIQNSTGTIVILKNCDRLQRDPVNENKRVPASELMAAIPHFLGRTYRKFIYGGLNIWVNKEKVYLHDPLFLMSPTRFDARKLEPKAIPKGKETIPLEIPGEKGKMSEITITMTLLPQEWRQNRQDGGRPHATERKIHENEGISILRAGREVLYGHVPYIIGAKGQARAEEIDRWWGCEISFPPELDEYFTVKFIKRGAEPVKFLRDKIRDLISPVIKELRKEIQGFWRDEGAKKDKEAGIFRDAEDIMAEADRMLPKGKYVDVPEDKAEEEFDKIAEESIVNKPVEEKKKKLVEMPYSIEPVRYPENVFFDTVHLLGRIIVKINVNHPFYKHIFEPLCGSVEFLTADADPDLGADTPEKRKTRRGFMLLLLSYAKAESFPENNHALISNLRIHWGMSLATAINKMMEKE